MSVLQHLLCVLMIWVCVCVWGGRGTVPLAAVIMISNIADWQIQMWPGARIFVTKFAVRFVVGNWSWGLNILLFITDFPGHSAVHSWHVLTRFYCGIEWLRTSTPWFANTCPPEVLHTKEIVCFTIQRSRQVNELLQRTWHELYTLLQ